MEEKRINLSINDGGDFFAHEVSINFNPLQFIFDFKCITPRVDPRSKDAPTLSLKHNVVLTDPYHAKKIAELLNDVIKKYEKEFGKIEKPKALELLEKKSKKSAGDSDKIERSIPAYLG
ncbi:MAG: DUF3467 domain-containing protein [Candidatus Woesearchaeota archaeon]